MMRLELTGWVCAFFGILLCGAVGEAETSAKLSPGMRFVVGDEARSLPLAKTKVQGRVEGFVAQVKVTQTFVNPFDDFIEATYVFPLSENGAVTAMVMHLADRDVVAEIKLREEAQKIYEEAKSAGKTAALLSQERDNIFTQKVGNIPPGDTVEVELTYVEQLPCEKGVCAFVFPTVVGPRYIPGAPLWGPREEPAGRSRDTSVVPDASCITPPSFDEGQLGAHRIDLELQVSPGLPIKEILSVSHDIEVDRRGPSEASVRIAASDEIPNKDFVVKIDLRGELPEAAVLTHKVAGEAGYVTVALQPPAFPKSAHIAPKDLFFVLDNSGSMSGVPLEASKALVIEALRGMNPKDRFTVMRFSDDVSSLSVTPLRNTPDNVKRGIAYVEAMQGMGGTEMLSGVREAISGSLEAGRVRIVFFLTDGYIGNDDEILAAIQNENRARARIFSMGVGSSVNRYLLAGMARLGRGEMQVMRYDEDVQPFVQRFYDRVRNPVLTGVSLTWRGLEVDEQTPSAIPDLFDGRPLVVHARYDEPGTGELLIRGRLGAENWSRVVPVTLPERSRRPAVANLWAREMIRVWTDEETRRPGSRRDEIVTLALGHNLMTRYTSFVAVDKQVVRSEHEPLIPVAQRLPLPEGVSRSALGDLSRNEIPPGDPFIAVYAPRTAKRVTAYFPFGLVKDLRYDEPRDAWRGRFLVPAGIPDGWYPIEVVIEMPDESLYRHRQLYHLDSSGAEVVTNFEGASWRAGTGRVLEVDTIEPAAEVYIHCEELGWNRVELLEKEGREAVDWHKWMKISEGAPVGPHEVLVVMRDLAGNRAEHRVTITVVGKERP